MTEIEKQIADYYMDPKTISLTEYYKSDNIWKTLGVERDENSHSSFLAWVLDLSKSEKYSPLYRLIYLLARSANKEDQIKSCLTSAIVGKTLTIKSSSVKREQLVNELSTIRFNDRIDLYTDLEIGGVEGFSFLEIFIENKVGSSEGKNKLKNAKEIEDHNRETPQEKNYKEKMQTQRYYYACCMDEGNRKKSEKNKENTLQLFAFLTPDGTKPADDHFITITYQDLVDNLYEPYLKSNEINEYTRKTIFEYVKILGNPFYNNLILATMTEERELLKDFYEKNHPLFRIAIDAMLESSEYTEEEKQVISDTKVAMDKLNTIGKRRFYSINNGGKHKMYEVVAEFVKYRLKQGDNLDSIEEFIKEAIKTPSDRVYVSNNKKEVYRYQDDKGKDHFHTAEYNGNEFYITKEWGGVTKEELEKTGRKNPQDGNFVRLLNEINKKYTEFQIEEIRR